jgi:hypothetical protein
MVRRAELDPAAAAARADFDDDSTADAKPRSYYALSSAFFGVEYDSRLKAWIVTYYTADGKRVFGGSYDTEEAAALGYNACLEAARLRYKKNDVGDDGRPRKPRQSSPFYGVTATPAQDGSTSGWKAYAKVSTRWGFDSRRTENIGYYDRPCEGSAALAVDAFLRREAPPVVAARKVNFPTVEELLMCAAPGDPAPAPVAVPPRICVFFESAHLGITLEHDENEKRIVFDRAAPDSPAHDAGVKPGDFLVRINGRACGAVDDDAWFALIRSIQEGRRVAHLPLQKLVLEFEWDA